MYDKLLRSVKNLGSPTVLVAGDFMLDIYVYGDALRISPEAPVPVLRVTRTEFSCGGAGSVVADLLSLGAKPVCIGIIGDDDDGRVLANKLSDAGADIAGLLTADDRPTISKERLIGLAQHRHRQQLMRIDRESAEPLCDSHKQAILKAYTDCLADTDIVCLQDYNKGVLCESLCPQLIALATDAGKSVLVDPAPTDDYSKYTGATLITPNRKETALAVGFDITDAETTVRAAASLQNELKLDAVVITLDKEGAYLRAPNIAKIVPTRPRSVYDVTGAGDMVLATLAVTLACGCDYETAVHIANTAGGIEVEKFGAATVTVDEIITELVGQNRAQSGKLRCLESLLDELRWHRKQGKAIVFTNGCFDVLHRGHIEYLRFCKQQGDTVVLGLNSDGSIRKIKGPGRPVNSEHDRAEVLAALESVDYITVFDAPTPLDLIKQVRPDILVKGEDWKDKGVVGREFVESYGGRVELARLIAGRSSTATIEKMKTLKAESE